MPPAMAYSSESNRKVHNPSPDREFVQIGSNRVPKKELLEEIASLRGRIEELEKTESERKLMETALQQRLAMEKLVASISTGFINVIPEEIDREIEHALQAIGEYVGVDQSYFCLTDREGKIIETFYSWTCADFKDEAPQLKGRSLAPFRWMMDKFRQFEAIFIESQADLPPAAAAEKEACQRYGIQSILAIPLSMNNGLAGFLGLNLLRCEKKWAEEDIALMKVMGDILVNVLGRKRAELALQESEKRYRMVTKISTDGASSMRLEKDGSFVREWITESLSRIFGINPEEDLDSFAAYVRHIHPEDLPIFARLVASFPKNPKSQAVEIRVLTKNGDVRWLRDVIYPEWNEEEQRVVRLVHAVQDITDRKRAEEELKRSEEKYRLLVRNAPLGIISLDPQGQIMEVNPTFLKIFRTPSEEVLRATHLFTYPPFVDAGIAGDLRCCLETQEPAVHERLYRTSANQEVFLRYHLTPLCDPQGKMTGLQAVVEDITESKRLEHQLLQAQKMEAIGTLAGGIAHDFNNILSGIIGYGELIAFDLPEGSRAESYLQELLKASQRAKDLVKQILAFGRRSEQEKKAIQVEPLLIESLKLLRASLPATVQIRQEIDGDPGVIRANPIQIQQVVMNLGTNAAQAMPDGGGIHFKLKKVDVSGGWAPRLPDIHPGSYICLTVSDTGQGMPPEVLRRIFDPYFTTKERGKGTGLGLAVAHGIIKNHDGAITVYSEPGQGTTFEIYLPRVNGCKKVEEARRIEAGPLKGHERILYVDDEQILVQVGQQLLEKLGYQVFPVMDSRQALELFRAESDRFDLVVTDMTMPFLTGEKLAKEILAVRPNMPVVLCTGFSERITEKQAKEMGIREFLSKPFDMNDLARAVRKALEPLKTVSVSV